MLCVTPPWFFFFYQIQILRSCNLPYRQSLKVKLPLDRTSFVHVKYNTSFCFLQYADCKKLTRFFCTNSRNLSFCTDFSLQEGGFCDIIILLCCIKFGREAEKGICLCFCGYHNLGDANLRFFLFFAMSH